MSTHYPEIIGLHLSYVRGISVEEKLTDFFVVFCAKLFGDQDGAVEGDRGAGARENRGREGYGRREKKGREAGSIRWREAGEKFKKASFCFLLLFTSSQRNEPNNVS